MDDHKHTLALLKKQTDLFGYKPAPSINVLMDDDHDVSNKLADDREAAVVMECREHLRKNGLWPCSHVEVVNGSPDNEAVELQV